MGKYPGEKNEKEIRGLTQSSMSCCSWGQRKSFEVSPGGMWEGFILSSRAEWPSRSEFPAPSTSPSAALSEGTSMLWYLLWARGRCGWLGKPELLGGLRGQPDLSSHLVLHPQAVEPEARDPCACFHNCTAPTSEESSWN